MIDKAVIFTPVNFKVINAQTDDGSHSKLSVRLTLAITWPQGLRGEEYNVTAAAQVYGVVGQDRE